MNLDNFPPDCMGGGWPDVQRAGVMAVLTLYPYAKPVIDTAEGGPRPTAKIQVKLEQPAALDFL